MDRKIYGKEIVLESDERESGERNSFSKPSRPRRSRRVYLNSLLALSTTFRLPSPQRQVCFVRPTFRFPCGFQASACLVTLEADLWSVWSIHPQFRFLISESIGAGLILSRSCWFAKNSGHLMLRMFLRHLLINVWSLRVLVFVTRQVSEP